MSKPLKTITIYEITYNKLMELKGTDSMAKYLLKIINSNECAEPVLMQSKPRRMEHCEDNFTLKNFATILMRN